MNQSITNVNLDITTFCDRACPNCCAATNGKLFRPQVHHDWAYFERAAKVLYGIERVLLCGGEPTYHPQFAEFVPKFKELFGCKTLAMVTDGWGVELHYATIRSHIDEIDYTDYWTPRGMRAGAIAEMLMGEKSATFRVFNAGPHMENFTPRSRVGGGQPCERAWWRSGTIAYADGKVYGCCVAPGIEGSDAMEIPADFADESLVTILPSIMPLVPCGNCFFSE